MADETMTITLDGDIELSLPIGHVTSHVSRCPKCGQLYTADPFFFGHCPHCGYKKEE